jgi:predicted phosphodiesterase
VPERLALIGDVHANAPALRAVLDAIAGLGIERGVCTGDLVMRGADPEECVRLLRGLGWPCVRGNTDRKVAVRQRRDPAHPKARRIGSRAWSTNQLSPESIAYLGGLRLVERVALRRHTLVLMHGGPDDPRDAVSADTPAKELRRVAAAVGDPDLIVSGHTHRPHVLEAGRTLFVNPGAVGEADDGDRRPAWAWISSGRSGLEVHLERVPEELARIRTP